MHHNSMLLTSNNRKTLSTEPNRCTTGSVISLLTGHLHTNTKELGLHASYVMFPYGTLFVVEKSIDQALLYLSVLLEIVKRK
jgi:hypothetical protein